MSIQIITYGSYREGREKDIEVEYTDEITLRNITELLNIDPQSIGIVKINELTGPLSACLDEIIPDGSCIQFLPFLTGG